jgi:hypothetical protein
MFVGEGGKRKKHMASSTERGSDSMSEADTRRSAARYHG